MVAGDRLKKYKRLNDVYMREVTKSDIKVVKDEKLNAYITYKHVIDISHACTTYINGRKVIILDKGYTILEYSPIGSMYNVRIFIDDKNHILLYYIDIIEYNEFKDGEVYYQDLFLDIVYYTKYASKTSNFISLVDENELMDALNNKEITKREFDRSYEIANYLMDEILAKKNIYINRKLKDYKKMKKLI